MERLLIPRDRSLLTHPQNLPDMVTVMQHFDDTHLADPVSALQEELRKPQAIQCLEQIKQGDRVAIGCSSRGISHMASLLKALVDCLRNRGARPFLFPAMGSHGGATVQGQLAVLESYGITEQQIGAPICATMNTVCIGETSDGQEVHLDACAERSEHIVFMNRIKAHTAFEGQYESGLMKMLAIGMGKHAGAQICHQWGFERMAKQIPLFAEVVLAKKPILFGIALIENAYEQTCKIELLPAQHIPHEEPRLLAYAKSRMGRLLFRDCDVLVVDYLGKDKSGEGMDPHITGRFPTDLCKKQFSAQKLVVLDVSPASHGNCYGVGLADITTSSLVEKADFYSMYVNAMTNRVLKAVHLPMVCRNHEEAIKVAVSSCVSIDKGNPRIIRLADTTSLRTIMVSKSMLDEVLDRDDMTILKGPFSLSFDEEGNLF